jgi:hypothetical protein
MIMIIHISVPLKRKATINGGTIVQWEMKDLKIVN